MDYHLDYINLLDVWNSKEEKKFLWDSFYKYNIDGKVIECSVLKGLNEILCRDGTINSIISLEEKKEDYSTDDLNIIRLSYNKKKSSSIIKSSINSTSLEINKNSMSDRINLEKFVENNDIKELKQIKNIMILLNENYEFDNNNSNIWLVELSQIDELFSKYPCIKIEKENIINYLYTISENNEKIKNNKFIINKNLLGSSLKLIENKITKFDKESIYNEELSNKIINKKEIINKNLNILFDKIIEEKIKIDKENKELILKKKEEEKKSNEEFNIADEKINK